MTFNHHLAVAVRTIGRAPAFASTAIVILGLGVGMATAMFAIYKTVLVDRLPVTAQDRLVVMHPWIVAAPISMCRIRI